jgi:hypothetical protein
MGVIRIAYDPAPPLVPKTFNVTIPKKKFQMIMPNTVWRSQKCHTLLIKSN